MVVPTAAFTPSTREAPWDTRPKSSSTPSCRRRLREHLLAGLVCPGRHTLSGLITVCGGQFVDWSADYDLYSKDRVSPGAIFRECRREVESLGQRGGGLRIAIDDTILRKRGRRIPGTAYRRDPLGPRFQVNLVWAQRMLQVSGAVVDGAGDARMAPIHCQDASTPEQLRQDPGIPWQGLQARVNGKSRKFEIKTLSPVRWRAAGEIDLRLLVIRPVGFRPRKGARMSYTRPAYLICTDARLPAEEILQEYVWRWDIEVNHREEKTILGVGQAQVRNPNSAEDIPASAVAAYAMLHLAAIKAYGKGGKPAIIPEAKWRRPWKKIRPSTQDLLNEFRRELWANAIREPHLSDFMNNARGRTKSNKSLPDLCSTLFAATA